jgi:trigger factor
MEVTVSRVSPVEVEVKVSLPKEQVTTALARAYAQLGKQAQIRGFRKGKVPLPLLKQYFGPRVAAEVSEQLVQDSLNKALTEQKLEPIVQPTVQPETAPEEEKDWAYTAKLEVRPAVEKIELEGIALERKVYEVTDADVDHQIEHLREKHSTLRTPEPARAVQNGDIVTLDYDVTIDGAAREELNARNRSVEVGKGRLLKELDAGIVGMAVGERKDITVHFPDDHAREDLRGKDAVLKVTVSEVREKVLPAVDDDLAKDEGDESLAALKTKLRTNLEKEGKDASEMELREDAVTKLVEKNPIAVPPSLVQNAVMTIAREVVQQMRMSNTPFDADEVLKMAREQAEQRVRAGLLLAEMARANNLTVTDDDLNARMDEIAKETNKAVAKVRADHRDARRREALANAVLEDKVLQLLLSKVSVKDVPAGKPVHEHEH